MLNNNSQTETNLSLWKYFTDVAANVGIRIFRMDQNSQNESELKKQNKKRNKRYARRHPGNPEIQKSRKF